MISFGTYAGALVASFLTVATAVAYIYRNFERTAAVNYFLLFGVGMLGWTGGSLLQLFVPVSVTVPVLGFEFEAKRAIYGAKFASGWFGSAPMLLMFTLAYTNKDRWITARKKAVYVGTWAVAGFVAVTDHVDFVPWRGIMFADFGPVDAAGFVMYDSARQPLYKVALALDLLAVIGSLVILLRYAIKSRRISRAQTAILGGAGIPPWALSVAKRSEMFGISSSMDVVPIALAPFFVMVMYAMFRHELFEVSAMSRDHIMSTVTDAIVSLDENGRVVDFNQAADDLFDLEGKAGEDVADVLPTLITNENGDGAGQFADEITLATSDDRRYLNVKAATFEQDGEIQGYTIVLQDVTALRELNENLQQQTEQLDQFASTVSHDLRNPLTIARSYSEMFSDTDREDAAEEVQDALDRMDQIIDDALTLAREGEAIEERNLNSLRVIVEEAWRTSQTEDATLDVEFDDGIQVYTDENRLQNLFENLFRNAVDHGPADATIWVGTHEEGFYVEDNGPGIPEEDRDDVFDSGYTTGGTGLGLAIVDQIADAHGWSVRADAGRQAGAKFVVSGVDLTTKGASAEETSRSDGAATGSSSAP